MDIAGKARKLERRISRTVDAAVGGVRRAKSRPAPLEIVHAVLDRAETRSRRSVADAGCFRSTGSVVQWSRHAARQGVPRAVCRGRRWPPSLSDRLRAVARRPVAGSSEIDDGGVSTSTPGANWAEPDFHVEFDRIGRCRRQRPPERRSTSRCPAEAHGREGRAGSAATRSAAGRSTSDALGSGRSASAADPNQPRRVLEDGPDENRTVSRRHAHIEFSEPSDVTGSGTIAARTARAIIRRGRTIRVPPGARGMRMETDDEIVLGQARIRVDNEIAEKARRLKVDNLQPFQRQTAATSMSFASFTRPSSRRTRSSIALVIAGFSFRNCLTFSRP